MNKLIFLDIDGTLVDYENQLPPSAAAAVRRTRELGNRVYLCTGRLPAEITGDIQAMGFDGMIGGNGTYIRDGDTVLADVSLTKEEADRILDWLEAHGFDYYVETNGGLYASSGFEDAAYDAVNQYREGAARPVTVREAFHSMHFDESPRRDGIKKISYLLRSPDDLEMVREAFPEFRLGRWGGRGDVALFGDIGVQGIDKGRAVHMVADHEGVPAEDTYGFGDATPDIPMLAACGTGTAMGGGGPEIKAAADYVTDTVEADGLEKAFRHLGLLGE